MIFISIFFVGSCLFLVDLLVDFDVDIQNELSIIVDTIVSSVLADKIFLFGSFANGSYHTGSDFDIFVLLDCSEERPIKSIQKIYRSLARLDIRSVDVLANYSDVFFASANVISLEQDVLENGVVLFERYSKLKYFN